jgi:hypothetical protein
MVPAHEMQMLGGFTAIAMTDAFQSFVLIPPPCQTLNPCSGTRY